MLEALMQLGFFTAKAIIIVVFILLLLSGIIALLSRGKNKSFGQISIKNLNDEYAEVEEIIRQEILSKKSFKEFMKKRKKAEKKNADNPVFKKTVFVIHFIGDIKASAVSALREEITAILNIATSKDEVVVCLESAGGMVHAYGLAAAQLLRIRQAHIPLTVIVDKVAASGGYMMAAVANKILSAPYAIIGSIGVVFQLPNFHKLLKDKKIDFEQITAGNYKRTLSVFGENTEEGREKCHADIEKIHELFKDLVHEHRKEADIEKVSTGEHWLAKQAIELHLVDYLITSDDYLLQLSKKATLFEIHYEIKKTLGERLFSAASLFITNHLFSQQIKN